MVIWIGMKAELAAVCPLASRLLSEPFGVWSVKRCAAISPSHLNDLSPEPTEILIH